MVFCWRDRRSFIIRNRVRADSTSYEAKSFRLGSVSIVVVEQPTEPCPTADLAAVSRMRRVGQDQSVAESLVIAFMVIMRNKFLDRLAQRTFSEQNHSIQARLLDGPDESLRVGVQIR